MPQTDEPEAPAGPGESYRIIEPVTARFRLTDGQRVSGRLTAWSDEHLEGSFGRHRWIDMDYRDLWRIRRQLMDHDSPEQWLSLGRLLLLMSLDQDNHATGTGRRATSDIAEMADRAFRQAQQLRPELSEKIAQIRHEFFEEKKRREEAQAARQAQRVSTTDPEAADWPDDAWPGMGPADQHAALRAVRDEADEIAAEAGIVGSPLDTGHFLLYGELTSQRLAALGSELERTYALLAGLLEVEETTNIFWGRAVVVVLPGQDRFRLIEAQRFQQIVDRDRVGIAHFMGPQTFILIRDDADEAQFTAGLAHVVTHAFMHRFISPRRLPPWANEGLAEYVSGQGMLGRALEESKRKRSLSFVRSGRDVAGLVEGEYGSEQWSDPGAVGAEVGGLLVELLLRSNPERFVRWVKAVKLGQEWRHAFAEQFGATPARFVGTAVRFYRVND